MGDWNYDVTYVYIYSHSATAHMKCAALCHTLIKLFKKTNGEEQKVYLTLSLDQYSNAFTYT